MRVRPDTVRFTLAGTDGELQRTVEQLPDEAPVDAVRLTGFETSGDDAVTETFRVLVGSREL